jgi:hypothetical protein
MKRGLLLITVVAMFGLTATAQSVTAKTTPEIDTLRKKIRMSMVSIRTDNTLQKKVDDIRDVKYWQAQETIERQKMYIDLAHIDYLLQLINPPTGGKKLYYSETRDTFYFRQEE